MSNLYLTNIDMSAACPNGSETTRHKLNGSSGAASTLRNKNCAASPPLKITDGTTAGTDGASIAWYSEQLQAVTIAGQIVASLWGRESATTANAAPCIGVYRCDEFGGELATIVNPATVGSQGATEFATTAGGATKTCTISAANVVDTAIAAGERLKVALFIDSAANQGGSGTMGTTQNTQLYVNGPNGAAGQAQIAFAETILSVVVAGARQPIVSRRAAHRAAVW